VGPGGGEKGEEKKEGKARDGRAGIRGGREGIILYPDTPPLQTDRHHCK